MSHLHQRLLRIGTAEKQLIKNWKEGVAYASYFNTSLEILIQRTVVGRWKLALEHRRDGNRLFKTSPCPFRSVISRYYYSMYHIARAVVFVDNAGDDHQSHADLPKHFPKDFPNRADWINKLKSARIDRNAADYDSYPKGPSTWRTKATRLKNELDALVLESKLYLTSKGIPLK